MLHGGDLPGGGQLAGGEAAAQNGASGWPRVLWPVAV